MNESFHRFKENVKGKTVAVVGIGISNKPLIKLLVEAGARVTARDRKQPHLLGDFYNDLLSWDVEIKCGEDYLSELNEEIIFKSPGIRFDLPAFKAAERNGQLLTSEMEIFFDVCEAPIIGITGSDGKTTTTMLIHEMLKSQGIKAWIGGNVGYPLLSEADNIKATDIVVLELSSFQLHTLKKSPHIAVITNFSPNHLDIHLSLDEYFSAKSNILLYQNESDKLIINYDNKYSQSFAQDAKANVIYFSRQTVLDKGFFVENGNICYNDGLNSESIISVDEIMLPGAHNLENYLAAIAAVNGLVKPSIVRDTAKSFKGAPHRLEFVRELNGVLYYNDSKATTPTSAIAALHSFSKGIILIAGGYDKKLPLENLSKEIIAHAKRVILTGDAAARMKEAIISTEGYTESFPVSTAENLRAAVVQAKNCANTGDVVILSPACSSFDAFENFEERGNYFKHVVNEL